MALSCAFVGYCGPFNQEFRDHLVKTRFSDDLVTRGIPLTKGLGLTSFLVDMGTIGDWNLDGLPTDPLSIQNGILVSLVVTYSATLSPYVRVGNFRQWRNDSKLEPFLMQRCCKSASLSIHGYLCYQPQKSPTCESSAR